jgi:antitoxin component YwqK of YwqJK toxin-antitoxin module
MERKLVNKRNSQGERHGLWEDYYDNGQLYWKCNYHNGKYHGLLESYHSNGQLYWKGNLKNDKEIGLWKEKQ